MRLYKMALTLILLGSVFIAPGHTEEDTCNRFAECIQKTLGTQEDIERVLYTTRALQLWEKSIPQRDLINVLKLHAESLLKLQLTGKVPEDMDLLSVAEADYQRFLKLEPGNWLPLAGLGKIAEMRGQIQAAENFFKQSVKAKKTPAYIQRAAFYERQSKYALALEDLNQALLREKNLAQQKMGLPPLNLALIYVQRARVHAYLKHALDEQLDRDTACKLGLQQSCPGRER